MSIHEDFPIGHFDPTHLAKAFSEECGLIGGLVIAWGQFDREVCNLFSRLLGFPGTQPTDKRAHAIFYSSTNPKARRDAMTSLIKLYDDELCKEWLATSLEKVGQAADRRNDIIHSEFFADLLNPSDSHLFKNVPVAKKPTVKRQGIRYQIKQAIIALHEAQFYMEFAFAATRSRENLEQALALYEPALRRRREAQLPHNPPQGSR